MDSELRRRFLKLLDVDFAALDMRAAGIVRPLTGRADWEITGPRWWPHERAWWLDDDPTPVANAHGRDAVRA